MLGDAEKLRVADCDREKAILLINLVSDRGGFRGTNPYFYNSMSLVKLQQNLI